MIIWAWIVKNWGWLWKVLAAVGAALILWWAVSTVLDWKADSDALPEVKKQAVHDLAVMQGKIDNLQSAYDVAYKASKEYQDELAKIRDMPIPVNTVIRVCKPISVPSPETRSAAAPGPDAAAPAAGVLSEPSELDTRPIFGDAKLADDLSARVRGLQFYIKNQKCGG